MYAQLVLLARDRFEPVQGLVAAPLDDVDARFGVGFAFFLAHAEKWRAGHDAAVAHQRELQALAPWRHCLIYFFHRALAKQCLVDAARFRVVRKQNDAGGFAVQSVQRHEFSPAEFLAQAHQQGFMDEAPCGCHGQEMRLVDGDDMAVAVEYGFFERDGRFRSGIAVVKDAHAARDCAVGGERLAVQVDHFAFGEARIPVCRLDFGKPFQQKIPQVIPAPFRYPEEAGADAVLDRQRCDEFLSLPRHDQPSRSSCACSR